MPTVTKFNDIYVYQPAILRHRVDLRCSDTHYKSVLRALLRGDIIHRIGHNPMS